MLRALGSLLLLALCVLVLLGWVWVAEAVLIPLLSGPAPIAYCCDNAVNTPVANCSISLGPTPCPGTGNTPVANMRCE